MRSAIKLILNLALKVKISPNDIQKLIASKIIIGINYFIMSEERRIKIRIFILNNGTIVIKNSYL